MPSLAAQTVEDKPFSATFRLLDETSYQRRGWSCGGARSYL